MFASASVLAGLSGFLFRPSRKHMARNAACRLVFVLGLISVTFAQSVNLFQYGFRPVPKCIMDLDLPPTARWTACVNTLLDAYGFQNSFGTNFEMATKYEYSRFLNYDPNITEVLWSAVQKYWPEQAGELQGIANALAQYNVTAQYLTFWVYCHELGHVNVPGQLAPFRSMFHQGCAAVLVQRPDGTILHGRNLDNTPPVLGNMTLDISFVKQGKVLYEAIDFWWVTSGIETIMQPGFASISENSRDNDGEKLTLDIFLANVTAGALPQPFYMRQALDAADSNFTALVYLLSTYPAMAPQYLVVAGTQRYQGVSIARQSSLNTTLLPMVALNETNWGFIQTNSDLWIPEPDPRRIVGNGLLQQLGQQLAATELSVYNIMNTWPIRNDQTLYTVVMHPAKSKMVGYLQNGFLPIPPPPS